jgi:hypothetical protein
LWVPRQVCGIISAGGGVAALPVTANLLGTLSVAAPHSRQYGRGAMKDWMTSKRCPSRQRSS